MLADTTFQIQFKTGIQKWCWTRLGRLSSCQVHRSTPELPHTVSSLAPEVHQSNHWISHRLRKGRFALLRVKLFTFSYPEGIKLLDCSSNLSHQYLSFTNDLTRLYRHEPPRRCALLKHSSPSLGRCLVCSWSDALSRSRSANSRDLEPQKTNCKREAQEGVLVPCPLWSGRPLACLCWNRLGILSQQLAHGGHNQCKM